MTELTVSRVGRRLDIEATLPENLAAAELRFASDRNRPVVRDSDRSPNAPTSWPQANPDIAAELWLPVVDIELQPVMCAAALFDNPEGSYAINALFGGEQQPLTVEVIVPAERLEHWENGLWTSSKRPTLTRFELRIRFDAPPGRFQHTINLLSDIWSGDLSLWGRAADGGPWKLIASHTIKPTASQPAAPKPAAQKTESALTVPRLTEALNDAIGFVLRCRNTAPGRRTTDGFFLFYDLDARTFRTSHWTWPWGVTARMLLDASKLSAVQAAFGTEPADAAVAAGAQSLTFQWARPGHPADGLVTARWNPGRANAGGFREFVSTADASFLAGWGWAPLYEATGDAAFLDATRRLCEAIERLTREHDVAPLDWMPDTGDWKPFILNEAGFGAEAFAELYRITGEARWREAGCRFIDQLIAIFERPGGLWERSFDRPSREVMPCQHHTRGQGWAMEGLLAAARMAPDGPYLDKARRLASHLINYQRRDGAWTFAFNTPGGGPIAEKGTALWSLLLYRLASATGDAEALAAARRALTWCIDNQYHGPDPDAHGSLPGSNPNSGVVYRPWFNVSCLYTSAFMGLAALEEMQLATG